MPEAQPIEARGRPRLSRRLYAVDRWAARPLITLIVIGLNIVWVGFTIAFGVGGGISGRWETVLGSLAAAVTLAMVFIIQHTQSRQQIATHRKLDEILLALPEADNALVRLEHASDDELRQTSHAHHELRQAALEREDDQAGADAGEPGEVRGRGTSGPAERDAGAA
jgi:low affinity Fe/Cu permease